MHSKPRTNSTNNKYAIHLPRGAGESQPPRAIVFVFGWAFSRMKHVLKYSELYQDRGCATITGILPPLAISVKNDAVIADFCRGAMEEAAALIQKFEKQPNAPTTRKPPIPILVHAFCNGGAFCRLGLHQALASTTGNDEIINKPIRDRLAAEVLDSAPVYISTESSLAALEGVVKNPLIFWVLAIGGTFANYLKYFWSLMSTGEAFYVTFWNQMMMSDACPNQFLVYSSADKVCDHRKVDEFVEYRRAKGIGVVEVLKVTDTGHCRHLQKYRKEYCDMVDAAINKAVAEMEDGERDQKRSRM